jgi:hypothetical protein
MSYVTDRTYKSLSKRAKQMYGVVVDVRAYQDKEHCLKNQFFHAIDTLADLADLSHKHAVYAIKELIDRGILKRYPHSGHSTLYEYIPSVPTTPPPSVPTTPPPSVPTTPPPSVPTTPPPSVPTTPPPSVFTTPHNNCIEQIQLTTTGLTVNFYNDMVSQYGKEAVDVVVVNLEKMNGEVKNFAGYVQSALKNGYVPTNKTIQEKEKAVERTKKIEEARQKEMIERAEIIKRHEESKMTPEQIKKMIDQVGVFA